ncbi:hypothetical protein [Alkalihalobacterium bogoriense]|uniref:hypothetical protein n=1 Tax=Alkalihalobacterium bogoriense TaxID=246272 RepID=UPI00047BDE68|nr:hypothetical protein [Alkalihalobacterium bogoriense]
MNQKVEIRSNIDVEKLVELNLFHARYGLKVKGYIYNDRGEELEGVLIEERRSLGEEPNVYLLSDIEYTNILNGFYNYDLKEAKRLLLQDCTFSLSRNDKTGFYQFTFIRSINDIFVFMCSKEERDYLFNFLVG